LKLTFKITKKEVRIKMREERKCVWCKKRPAKEGLALCEKCYELNERDAKLSKGEYNFRCPVCGRELEGRSICPECGVIRTYVMSMPSHCHICHCKYFYVDKNGDYRCWCCNAKWKESFIDDYITFALERFDEFKKWKEQRKVTEISSKK